MTTDQKEVDRAVACPDCHRTCGWCSWYAKNARQAGCGLSVPSGLGYRTKRRCEWGEQLKGTTCPTCGGTEQVRLVGRFEPMVREAHPQEQPDRETRG
jgi:hypothetical protein